MAAKGTHVAGLASRYAAALFELADEQKVLDRVAGDLAALKSMLAESADLARLVRNPLLGRAEQGRAMAAVLERAGATDLVRRFAGLLAQNRRLFALGAVIDAFLSELARRRGEVAAEVAAARPLTPEQQAALAAAIEGAVGGRVRMATRVDRSLIGGIVVRVGSRMYDGSLKSKLKRLRIAMKGAG